jgi:hypothetical protein
MRFAGTPISRASAEALVDLLEQLEDHQHQLALPPAERA